MKLLRASFAALARVLLSGMFFSSGINQILHWKEIEKQLLIVLGDWQTHVLSSENLQLFFSAAVVWAPFILTAATFLEILGALLLFFGIREKLGAALLVIVLIPTTVLMQHFWFSEGRERELQLALFLRDIAIVGGLFIVILHGAHGDHSSSREDSFPKMP